MKYLRGKATKLLAYILCAALVVPTLAGAAPMQVSAEQTQEGNVALGAEAITVEGTNSVGNLLATELMAEQTEEEQDVSQAYHVLDVNVQGNVATVEYTAAEDCSIIVGLYDEANGQMLASGVGEVSADEQFTDITISAETMPTYFVIKAYVVNSGNMKPLSQEYNSPLYTQDMQELLNSTVDDYEAERVLNLDEDKTNNFMVYGEDTILIDADETTNVVTKPEENGNVYKVTNIDANVSSLKVGDIVAIGSDENVVIIKVGSISIDGTTATIVEAEVELEEVFEVVKIQAVGDAADAVVDESTCEDGVTYVGDVTPDVLTGDEDNKKFETYGKGELEVDFSDGVHVEGKFEGGKKFEFLDKPYDENNPDKAKVSGEITVALGANVDFLITKGKRYVELYMDVCLSGNVSLSGEVGKEADRIEIGTADITIPTGTLLNVSIEPKFIFEASGEIEISAAASGKVGFKYNSTAVEKWSPITVFGLDFISASVEGKIKFGIAVEPAIEVIDESIAEVGLTAELVLETTIKTEGSLGVSTEDGEEHLCGLLCLVGNVSLVPRVSPKLEFVNYSIEVEAEIAWPISLGDWYCSLKYMDFGMGECPYKDGGDVETEVYVKDVNGNPVSGAAILVKGKADGGQEISSTFTTDFSGCAITVLPPGDYKFEVSKSTYKTAYRTIIDFNPKHKMSDFTLHGYDAILINPVNLGNGTGIVGVDGTSPYNNKYIDTLYIMNDDFAITGVDDPYVFRNAEINMVVLGAGVTTIPDYLFGFCKINHIKIPANVTTIGAYAFLYAELPEDFELGVGLKNIGDHAFCAKIVDIPKVVICEGMVLGEDAFDGLSIGEVILTSDVNVNVSIEFAPFNAATIKEVTFSKDVSTIPKGLFASSTVEKIELPEHITEIGERAFSNTKLPEGFKLGKGIKSIGKGAFYRGIDELFLPEVEIVDGMFLGLGAFSGTHFGVTIGKVILESDVNVSPASQGFAGATIKEVTISENVSKIPGNLFKSSIIEKIELPDSILEIGSSAFSHVDLTDEFEWREGMVIGSWAFQGASLPKVEIKEGMILGAYPFDSAYIEEVILDGEVDAMMDDYNRYFTQATIDEVIVSERVSKIQAGIFAGSTINEITIPSNVTTIENAAFAITTLPDTFSVSESVVVASDAFSGSTYTYPYETVEAVDVVAILPEEESKVENGITEVDEEEARENLEVPEQEETESVKVPEAITQTIPSLSSRTEIYTSLRPNDTYNFYVVKAYADFMNVQDILAPDNILYVGQMTSDEKGNATITYIPSTDDTYAEKFVTCMSRYDISTATIEQENMAYTGALQEVVPTVTYNGQALTVFEDFDIAGDFEVTEPGEYSITVQGANDYCGEATVTFKVIDENADVLVTGIALDNSTLKLKVQEEATLTATITPEEATNKAVTWVSSDESVATVDVNGKVTAVAAGSATITATAQDDSDVSASCEVTVVVPIVFEDVEAGAYYEIPVQWAVENGITNGYGSNTTFCPELVCTRGQIVTFLWRAKGCPEPASLNNPFTDVAEDAYYYKAVLWAVEQGITNGYGSDTIFNPDGECTRGQVATFMWRAEGNPANSGNNPFIDLENGAYYYDAVLWAVEKGVTNGYGSADTFCPDIACTRGQIVTFLYRGMN